ncbi:MAG TPA: DNA-binding response regulator [Bacteroidales bacterium]|nr:MAG: DNA-binding response regulator [Bacteroidetes bacterium GWE2_42_24]OFY26477.1 MAG: DNA-binding response regulator [Bacteroidetes bacterium GWF2_43_11]PKP16261.1 MAG: DNA-binding response regulator [Bacteroidetes bacterium HGW-Bacteroidetes-22]HAQ64290.1 DNA-binding response regulator [Bacteroidales bacterium]HBZ67714.1 DNA-binding response regulator [Bacteroidales bacterium]
MQTNNETARILLVDDEVDILEFLGYNLRKAGFEVHTAGNGQDGYQLACSLKPQLIVLDIMMPGMDGIETCQLIRQTPEIADAFIVFLTARGEDYSQIAGFDAGADDYVKKPVKPAVLVSRIKALLRRGAVAETTSEIIQARDFIIDKERYLVVKDEKEIALSKKEFELLVFLTSRPGKVFSRDDIFENVWGSDVVVGDRTIDVHIRKLREKIGMDYIRTYKGIGYSYV